MLSVVVVLKRSILNRVNIFAVICFLVVEKRQKLCEHGNAAKSSAQKSIFLKC